MASMEWNKETQSWIKQCSMCKKTFTIQADKWDEASIKFREFFYEFRKVYNDRNGMPQDDLHSRCKECHSHAVHKRDYNGKTRSEMLIAQQGRCAICCEEISFENKSAVIDHNHVTRAIRGVLCNQCNHGLGLFRESMSNLDNAILYLEKYKCE